VASSFGGNFNFLWPKQWRKISQKYVMKFTVWFKFKAFIQFFCQINYILFVKFLKRTIYFTHNSNPKVWVLQLVVLIIHHWLGKRLFLSIFVYKKLHKSFQITRKFHGMFHWNFTPFFGLRKLRTSPKSESTEGSRVINK
jgi:hypothetical protein